MDLQKKWDGVWKMKFIQQYKNLSKEIYILYGFPDLAASHFDFEK